MCSFPKSSYGGNANESRFPLRGYGVGDGIPSRIIRAGPLSWLFSVPLTSPGTVCFRKLHAEYGRPGAVVPSMVFSCGAGGRVLELPLSG